MPRVERWAEPTGEMMVAMKALRLWEYEWDSWVAWKVALRACELVE